MLEAEGLLEPDFQNIDGDSLLYRGEERTREEIYSILEQLIILREQGVEWNQGEPSLRQLPLDWIDDEESELFDLLGL